MKGRKWIRLHIVSSESEKEGLRLQGLDILEWLDIGQFSFDEISRQVSVSSWIVGRGTDVKTVDLPNIHLCFTSSGCFKGIWTIQEM